jgi:class 3 adenylate cyclase
VRELFERIRVDHRHHDVQCLENVVGDIPRQFPDWSMESIDLTQSTDLLMKPIRILSNTLSHTHRILEKYTQRKVLRYLADGIDPTTVPPQRTDRLVVFGDIMGFSGLSSVLAPEATLDLVNVFVSVFANALRAHGGEVHKLIGDSVMASFPQDRADDALAFAIELQVGLGDVRGRASPTQAASVLHGGVGISAGTVVIGNVGTDAALDFTLLGDAVNRASHLESLTRTMPWRVAFSDRVKALTARRWPFVPLGAHPLKEGAPVSLVYSIDHAALMRDPDGLDDRIPILRFISEANRPAERGG